MANTTLTGTDGEVVFSSIPATYRDLVMVIDGSATNAQALNFKVNGVTTDITFIQMLGNGSTTASNTGAAAGLGTVQGNIIINVMDYSVTDKHKTWLVRSSDSNGNVRAGAARWASTSAITDFGVVFPSTTFTTGTTFALYGIVS